MRVLFCLLLATGLLYAQGKRKPRFDVPKQAPTSQKAEQERDAADALRRTIERLSGWPSPRSRRAAERLIVQKEKSLERVVDILVSGHPKDAKLKAGAAYVVGRVGGAEHVVTLLLVASEKEQQRNADVFLEAALRLDRKAAVAEAFRYFHLAETTLRREAVKFVLNNVRAENLEQVLLLLDRRTADRGFTREIGLRLLDRLVQSKQVPWVREDEGGDDTGVGQYFYNALGDESPRVASRSMRLVAGRNDPVNIKALNHLITKKFSYWRQRSYAALALALYSAAYKEQPFEKETLEILRGPKGLEHPKETLARASSALALAQVALRTNDRDLVRMLDREIPILLIDAIGAGRHHYRDFGSVMPLAYVMLRRITGQTFPDHAPRWAKWWKDHGRLFRAKRELIEVRKEDLGAVELEVEYPKTMGGKRMRLSVIGERRPTFLHGNAVAVPTAEMERIVARLRSEGFFDAKEADRATIDEDAALLILRIGDLDRKVAYEAGEKKSSIRDAILAGAQRLADEYAWQRWWDADEQPSWQLFFVENQKWFSEHRGVEERAARLRSMVAGSLDDLLAVEARMKAVRFVASLAGGGGALTDEEVAAFVKAVGDEPGVNEFVSECVDLLVPAAGERAVGPLIEILGEQIGLNAKLLLSQLCRSLETEQVLALASDPRWKVRRAAVAALAKAEPATVRPILTERLEDERILVRVEAALALAKMKDPVVMPVLGELAGSELPEVRGAAAYAYGILGTPESRSAIEDLLYRDQKVEVRVRAVRGLVDSGETGGALALVGVFESENDIRVRASAAAGIVKLETPELVDTLVERLKFTGGLDPERVALVNVLARFESSKPTEILQAVLNGDDQLSASAAALGLARRWDDAALVQLIKMVRRGHSTRAAIRHLQLLTSQSFQIEKFEEQAQQYSGWATAHGGENARIWFRDALEKRGFDVRALDEWAKASKLEPVPDGSVPILLRALRDKDWFIQRNASFLLSRRIGEGAPKVISYATTAAATEAAIRAYHDWWKELGESKKAAEEG